MQVEYRKTVDNLVCEPGNVLVRRNIDWDSITIDGCIDNKAILVIQIKIPISRQLEVSLDYCSNLLLSYVVDKAISI